MCVLDEVSASLMNTIPADARLCQVREPKERCSAPAEKRCSLISRPVSLCVSDLLFPTLFSHFLNARLSFLTITFLHSFTLSHPSPPPTLPYTLAASLRSIFPLHPLQTGSPFDVFIFRRLQGASALCVPY